MNTLLRFLLPLLLSAGLSFAAAPYHTKTTAGLEGALIQANGQAVEASKIQSKKYLFIYFSAHWCPPCRAFTPKLVEFYNKNVQKGDFELLFVSSDKSQEAMQGYMEGNKMPWVGLKLDSPRVKELKALYGVRGIPCLVLLGENDEVIASSFDGADYKGPGVALDAFDALK